MTKTKKEEINEIIESINKKLANSRCKFLAINEREPKKHEILIKDCSNNIIIQKYSYESKKEMLYFLTAYSLIDRYIILLNTKFAKE